MTITGTTHRIRSGKIRLHVTEYGSRNNPVAVLVHGYPDNSQVWNRVLPLLADDFRVIVYDVRGAGQSDAPERLRDYSLKYLADDFEEVIDAVSPDSPVHVLAHDWGSIQCWEAVTEPRLQSRILSFTSISGPCLDHAGHLLRSNLKSRSLADLNRVAMQLLRSWYVFAFQVPVLAPALWRSRLGRKWTDFLRTIENIHGTDINPTQQQDGRNGLNLYRANVMQRLISPRQRRTDIPVQLIIPTEDHFVRPDIHAGVDQWAPVRCTEIIAGHWLLLSHPIELTQHFRCFTTTVTGKAA